ncbi:hypothetical protein PCASD_07482 [Puccinia coronata f. sp. avenae]|uniref:Uncharacterized protein n=1 Tax=Puccinia coronata f. sp. avenae TaxID=200324 RepID=A0A2N5TG70_9BASI|nr:hypothetical protein PCASD_07482 [Puccinia coronata f. sp. avenae]
MHPLSFLGIILSLALASVAQVGLTAQYFRVHGSNQGNIKLSWTANPANQNFTVVRKLASGTSSIITQVTSNIYDDYGPPEGLLTYQVLVDGNPSQSSNEVQISCLNYWGSMGFSTFDNTQPSSLRLISKIQLGSTYYNYAIQSDSNAMSQIVEQTSADGYTFSGERVVLTRKEVCAGSSDGFCKLEAVTFVQNPRTSEVLMWAHWENKQDYGQARVAVAFGQPGGKWTFGGSFRPLGHDSRDLSFFQDTDGSGYLISATSMNTDTNIYKLTNDWHNVTSLVDTVLKGEGREAPSLITHDNFYYLFSSHAAGWYPSTGQYISSKSLSGPWSQSRNIGNLAGFGAQSGGVQKIGSSWVMCANQWSAQWLDPEPPSRQIILPISLSNGYADYHFYPQLKYLEGPDQSTGVYGVQSGQIISIGQKFSILDDVSATGANKLTNGISLDPSNVYQSTTVPFSYVISFEAPSVLTQFDLTTKLVGGSETAYQFTISGRVNDRSPFKVIVDKSDNTRVGFVSSMLNDPTAYSAVMLTVQKVMNVHNKNDANWAEGINQFTVYGQGGANLDRAGTRRTSRFQKKF